MSPGRGAHAAAGPHGWVFRDTPVYDAAAAERHRDSMLALFDETLKSQAPARGTPARGT